MSDTGFREFLKAFTVSWFTLMCGPLTVPFAIAAVFVPQVWGRILWGTLAMTCIASASYCVWRKERRDLFNERARNQLPAIRGEASNFKLTGLYGSSAGKISGDFSCDLYLYNDSPRRTNFQGCELDGSALSPPVEFSQEEVTAMTRAVEKPPVNVTGQVLENGIGVHIKGTVFTASLAASSGHKSISLKNLKFHVVDGLRGKHLILVRDGENLLWDSN